MSEELREELRGRIAHRVAHAVEGEEVEVAVVRDVPLDVARRRLEAAANDDESPLCPPRRRAPSVRVAAAEVDDRRGGEARVALEDERRAVV